jgi:hypothetical protein
MSTSELWRFLPFGYLLTISIETPMLLVGLSNRHSWQRRLLAGIWLTGCTYPIVTLVLPLMLSAAPRWLYLLIAETFAPVGECILFWMAFGDREEIGKLSMWRDFGTIIAANLTSFLSGEVLNAYNWFGLSS